MAGIQNTTPQIRYVFADMSHGNTVVFFRVPHHVNYLQLFIPCQDGVTTIPLKYIFARATADKNLFRNVMRVRFTSLSHLTMN